MNSVYFERSSFEDVSVIRPVGKLTIAGGDIELRTVIADALESGQRKILLDLAAVTTIDSSGIGEVVGLYTTVTNRGGRLKILRLPSKLDELLHVTQLRRAFDVFRTPDAVIDAVGARLPAWAQVAGADALDAVYYSRAVGDSRIVVPRLVDATEELAAELVKEPTSIYQLPPRRFEELVAELVKQFGWNAELTPMTRDGGRDILAIIPFETGDELLCLIEVKRYRADRKVGVDLVRGLLGTVEHERANLGMLVTTSTFAKDALEFGRAHKFRLSLKDNADVFAWLQSYLRRRRA